ncbi:MAG: RluA family pseudouridine synthase [Flavobacteriaceae bacterium]
MHSNENNLQILFEDNHLVVVNKRCGDIVQGDKTGDTPLNEVVKSYIKKKYNKPGAVFLGTVHRLDRPTSGVVVYAKTSKALERMNKQFRDKAIFKTYWALIPKGKIPEHGHLEDYLIKNPKNNKSQSTNKDRKGAKLAVLNYRKIHEFDRYELLDIDLETGRHHQIRVQLSERGAPIKGDLKYGSPRSNPDAGISLHARKIEFTHPVTKEHMEITAAVPPNKIWDKIK